MRRLSLLVLGAVAVALAGCAGAPSKSTVAPSPAAFDEDVDYEYVTIVTDDARQRGHYIVWVHPPQKKMPVE